VRRARGLSGSAARRSGGSTARQRGRRGGAKGGGGTGVFPVGLRLGLGSRAQGLPFCRAVGSISACGPRKRSSPGILGRRCVPGKKGERGGRRALAGWDGGQ
jgi:hypothetical protein